jgi:hypothetical protein
MAIHYKVVELKGQRDPGSGAGDTPEVTAQDIETALNKQGQDSWDLPYGFLVIPQHALKGQQESHGSRPYIFPIYL